MNEILYIDLSVFFDSSSQLSCEDFLTFIILPKQYYSTLREKEKKIFLTWVQTVTYQKHKLMPFLWTGKYERQD